MLEYYGNGFADGPCGDAFGDACGRRIPARRHVWSRNLAGSAAERRTANNHDVGPAALTFSGQAVQTVSSAQAVTVTNTGTTSLTVSNISLSGDFLETDNCGNPIAANGTCQISVTFDPSIRNPNGNVDSGWQHYGRTGDRKPDWLGTTQSAIVVLPNSVNFGDIQVATLSASQQVTISNTGTAAIALTSESVTGPFAIQTNTCASTLATNTGCTLAIVFQPTVAGAATGALTVVTAQGTESVGLTGIGENPATDAVSPTSLVFPATKENTLSAPQTITLTNNGGIASDRHSSADVRRFSGINGCVASLNAQSACAITVQYSPHTTGTETGSIKITDSVGSQMFRCPEPGVRRRQTRCRQLR